MQSKLVSFPLNPDKSPALNTDWRLYEGEVTTEMQGLSIPTGTLVIDVDSYKGTTTDQIDEVLECKLDWHDAVLQKTLKGGTHYGFRVPNSVAMTNGTNVLGVQGFDTRAAGKGYIATGKGYEDLTLFGVKNTLDDPEYLPELPKLALEKLSAFRPSSVPKDDDLLTMVKNEPLDLTLEEVEEHVKALPAEYSEDRDKWLKTGLAIYRQTRGSEKGWLIFDEFSKRCPDKYNRQKNYQTWKSFNRSYSGEPVTFASIIHANKKDDFDKLLEECETLKDFDGLKKIQKKATKLKLNKQKINIVADVIKKTIRGTKLEGLTKPDIKKELKIKHQKNSNVPQWCRPWIFVSKTCEFLNTKTYTTIRREAFNARYNKEKECSTYEMTASNLALNIYQIQNVYDTIFNPKESEFFEFEGEIYFNIYRERGVRACENIDNDGQKVIDLFINHLDFLIESEKEKQIILNWMAYVVQNPGERINWALLIQGCQGCGKSYIAYVLMQVLGYNVTNLDPTAVAGRFSGWAHGSLIVAVEEIRIAGTNKYEVLDKLKPFLTNETVQIEEKGRDHRTVPNFTNYLMLTNHKDAIPLTDGDRRYCVIFSKIQTEKKLFDFFGGERETDLYFENLFNQTKRKADALSKFLNDYEITSEFKPKGRAPKTTAKELMQSHSTSPERNQIEDLISENQCEIINNKIVDITWLTRLAESECEKLPKTRAISAILLELGYENIEGRRVRIRKTKKQHTVWIKKDEIEDEPAKEIVKNYHDNEEKEDDIPF